MRRVLEDRPPEQCAGGEITDVLEMQEGLMLECGVVGGRDVPRVVGQKPDPERDRRAGQEPHRRDAADPQRERRWHAEDEQRGGPFGEDDVLEQVSGEQVVGERVERADGGDEQDQAPGGEGGNAPRLGPAAADQEGVRDGEREDAERRLGMERPGIGIRTVDGATLGRRTRA